MFPCISITLFQIAYKLSIISIEAPPRTELERKKQVIAPLTIFWVGDVYWWLIDIFMCTI